MSYWSHTLLVVVPNTLMTEANQLALAIGTSEDDVNTFRSADWTDGTNFYAVANTQAVDQIMDYFALVPAELSVNVVFPVIASSTITGNTTFTVIVDDALTGSDMAKIQVFVDQDPFYVLDLLGLSRV